MQLQTLFADFGNQFYKLAKVTGCGIIFTLTTTDKLKLKTKNLKCQLTFPYKKVID